MASELAFDIVDFATDPDMKDWLNAEYGAELTLKLVDCAVGMKGKKKKKAWQKKSGGSRSSRSAGPSSDVDITEGAIEWPLLGLEPLPYPKLPAKPKDAEPEPVTEVAATK